MVIFLVNISDISKVWLGNFELYLINHLIELIPVRSKKHNVCIGTQTMLQGRCD